MKIKALVPFSNGTISMEQYEVKEVTDTIGEQLVAAGVAVEIGGGSGGGVLVVTETNNTLDKTWQEIQDAFVAGSVRIQNGTVLMNVKTVGYSSRDGYGLGCDNYQSNVSYDTDSASGYPTRN